jgi:hypothetical protein
MRECNECPEGGVGLPAFDNSQMLSVDGRLVGSFFLREPFLLANLSETQGSRLRARSMAFLMAGRAQISEGPWDRLGVARLRTRRSGRSAPSCLQ